MRLTTLVLAAALALPGAALAQTADAQFSAEVRALVKSQLKALRRNDSNGFARTVSASIRTQFADPDMLLGVLSRQTPELADAAIVGFGDLKETQLGMTQMVRLSDRTGHPWLAFFVVEKDEAGAPMVKNVIAVKLSGQVV